MFHLVVLNGRRYQRLGRYAAPIETDTSELVDFDYGDFGAFEGCPDSGGIPAGAAAYDDYVKLIDGFNSLERMPKRLVGKYRA